MISCAYSWFPVILLCGFPCLLSLCTLVMSGSAYEHILLLSLPIYDSMHALCCSTCCLVLHPHSHNSKIINIYITQIWVYKIYLLWKQSTLCNLVPSPRLYLIFVFFKFSGVMSSEPLVLSHIFLYIIWKEVWITLKLVKLPNLHHCTKHINTICCRNFCEHVRKGLVKIFPNILRNRSFICLPKISFLCHCKLIYGQ